MVGYGTRLAADPESGNHKPVPLTYPLIRRQTTSPGQKLTPQILQLNGNPNDIRGGGTTCFGDSGGPVFLNGYLVADTSYGYTSNCRWLGGYQRVDIPIVQDWLAEFGIYPAGEPARQTPVDNAYAASLRSRSPRLRPGRVIRDCRNYQRHVLAGTFGALARPTVWAVTSSP